MVAAYPVSADTLAPPTGVPSESSVTVPEIDPVTTRMGSLSSIVTLNLLTTRSIMLAIVREELPAKSSPTGLFEVDPKIRTGG